MPLPGYIARMKAALHLLGYDENRLEIILSQMVAPFVAQEEVPGDKYQTDEELLDFARETGATV